MNTQTEYFERIVEEIHGAAEAIPWDRKKQSRTIIEGLVWGIAKLLGLGKIELGEKEIQRFKELVECSLDATAKADQLQRAAMEFPELGPPYDQASVDALCRLLKNQDKYVRASACKSLGRIGGHSAERALQMALNDDRTEVRKAAAEALWFCKICAVLERSSGLKAGAGIAPPLPVDLYSNPNQLNWEAYQSQEKDLLATHRGQFAAYHNGERIALGPDEDHVYSTARKKIPSGLIMTVKIIPAEERPIATFPSPWMPAPETEHQKYERGE